MWKADQDSVRSGWLIAIGAVLLAAAFVWTFALASGEPRPRALQTTAVRVDDVSGSPIPLETGAQGPDEEPATIRSALEVPGGVIFGQVRLEMVDHGSSGNVHHHGLAQRWTVVAEEMLSRQPMKTECTEDGNFMFLSLRPGKYRLTCMGAEPVLSNVTAGAVTEVVMTITGWMRVRGMVTDAKTGQGIAGAGVFLSPPMSPETSQIVSVTDQSGAFDAGVCTVGQYICVRTDGYEPSHGRILRPLAGPARNTEVDFALLPGGRFISGVVVSEGGDPVANASIVLRELGSQSNDPGPSGLVTETASDGMIRFTGVGTGACTLRVNCAGYAAAVLEVAGGGADHDLGMIRLRREAVVVGMVRNRDGAPIPGASVWIGSLGTPDCLRTVATEHGTFRLAGLPAGQATLSAAVGTRETLVSQTFHLVAGEVIRWDPIVGGASRPSLYGTVVRSNSSSVQPRWSVLIYPAGHESLAKEVSTDAQSGWEVWGLAPGSYDLAIRHTSASLPCHCIRGVEVPRSEPLTVSMDAAPLTVATIIGRVGVAGGRSPVMPSASCRVVGIPAMRHIICDLQSGEFVFSGVPLLPLELVFSAKNGLDTRVEVAPSTDSVIDLGLIELSPASIVRGLVDRDPDAPEIGTVVFRSHTSDAITYVPVGGDGSFLCTGLVPGPYTALPIGIDGHVAYGAVQVNVVDEGEVSCRLRVGANRRIRLLVTNLREGDVGVIKVFDQGGCIRGVRTVAGSRPKGAAISVSLNVGSGSYECRFITLSGVERRGIFVVSPSQAGAIAVDRLETFEVYLADGK